MTMRPSALKALVCLILAGAALAAPAASAQAPLVDQPSTTEIRLGALEAPLERGVIQVVEVWVTITYPILTSTVSASPIVTDLAVVKQPAWLAATLDPGILVFTPRGPASSGSTFVRDGGMVMLQLTLAETVEEALVDAIEIQACTRPSTGMLPSCGTGQMIIATAGKPLAPCDGSQEDDRKLDTVTTQGSTLAGVPVSTLAVAGVASVVGVAGGSLATHLLRRK